MFHQRSSYSLGRSRGGGGGGEVSQRKSVIQYDVTSRVSDFQNVEQILRAIIPTGHTFEGQCTARLRSLDTAIGGSSKDVLYFTLCVFSALQS